MGPPQELALRLRDAAAIQTFVETGTFQGRTAEWAAGHFKRVVTIERAPDLHAAASRRLANAKNLSCRFGHCRDVLASLLPELTQTSLFWLDAHWSGGVTYGVTDECPLLDEIAIIDQHDQHHVLLIDDARLFLAPPPAPHRPESWPSIDTVCRVLTARGDCYVCVHEDVIIRVPQSLRNLVIEYCREQHASRPASGRTNPVRRPKFYSWVHRLIAK